MTRRFKLQPSETASQQAVVQWFRAQFPRHTILAIPNGSHLAGDPKQRAIKMQRMKAEGLLPGAADLLLAVAFNHGGADWCAGLWIEMKAHDGRTTKAQEEFGARMQRAGYQWAVCKGPDDAMSRILSYMLQATGF